MDDDSALVLEHERSREAANCLTMKKVSKASRIATKEPAAKPKPKPKAGPGRRGRGSPAGAESGLLDGAMILSIALQLAKSVPLAELSIVRLASELGVTPALIHYYL